MAHGCHGLNMVITGDKDVTHMAHGWHSLNMVIAGDKEDVTHGPYMA